jgi:hypothetical protein
VDDANHARVYHGFVKQHCDLYTLMQTGCFITMPGDGF